jgi:hypothetical protein
MVKHRRYCAFAPEYSSLAVLRSNAVIVRTRLGLPAWRLDAPRAVFHNLNERSDRRRERWKGLNVALALFDRLGYVGTSMDAIRKAAGFRTKSSLYAHFPSQESLTATLLEKVLAEEASALAPYLNKMPAHSPSQAKPGGG